MTTGAHTIPPPRRVVRYRIGSDALGHYITFELGIVVLPADIAAHKLPPEAKLRWERLQCQFISRDNSVGPHALRRFFLEFANAMGWEPHLEA